VRATQTGLEKSLIEGLGAIGKASGGQDRQASAFDAEAFSRLLASKRDAVGAIPAHATVANQAQGAAARADWQAGSRLGTGSGKNSAIGDRILKSMQSVSEGFSETLNLAGINAENTATQTTYSVRDILKTQMSLVKLSVGCDIVAKGTSQAAKSINELTHLQ